jgi:hypothetical protein
MRVSKCQKAMLLMLAKIPSTVDGMNALVSTARALHKKNLIRPVIRLNQIWGYHRWQRWYLTDAGRQIAHAIRDEQH